MRVSRRAGSCSAAPRSAADGLPAPASFTSRSRAGLRPGACGPVAHAPPRWDRGDNERHALVQGTPEMADTKTSKSSTVLLKGTGSYAARSSRLAASNMLAIAAKLLTGPLLPCRVPPQAVHHATTRPERSGAGAARRERRYARHSAGQARGTAERNREDALEAHRPQVGARTGSPHPVPSGLAAVATHHGAWRSRSARYRVVMPEDRGERHVREEARPRERR